MQDGYLAYLNYQIKEEVVQNYLRERLILEEEKNEFSEELAAYREVETAAGEALGYLGCLLLTPDNLGKFFSLIGFQHPPFPWLSAGEITGQPPACPAGLRPKGLTDRGRYLDLIIKTYNEFRGLVCKGQEAADNLKALSDEINRDIRTFEQNYDIMSIIGFLKSLDVETIIKKRFLGDNFTPAEIHSLHEKMVIQPVSPDMEGVHSWPELPLPKEAKKQTMNFLYHIFQKYREVIRPALR
ncbi:MAG: hypothetical protein JRI95_13585 [Deltaproteobacteria bacterium]|nr:hypothetical protein [Deltaproteobacteria bacterium]MBW2086810.1 hypothetical protein [Deltaproteobacteria bacterium]